MKTSLGLFLFVLLTNLWIWRIFLFNIFVFLLVLITSVTFFLWLTKRQKQYMVVFLILFMVTMVAQWQTTKIPNLVYRDNDEQRVQVARLKEYSPTYIKIGDKTKWIPLGYWLDGRNEVLVYQRVLNNFFDNVDPNLYFFANHPRERGADEFEKYPYMLLPFFLLGLYVLVKKRDTRLKVSVFILPLLLLSIIGNQNKIGPFVLFPLLSASITTGLQRVFQKTAAIPTTLRGVLYFIFVVVTISIYIQVILYAIS